MPECLECDETRDCKNDLLQHVIIAHDSDMDAFPLA